MRITADGVTVTVGAATATQQQVATTADPTGTTDPVVQSGLLTFEVSSDDALRVIEANNGQSKMYLVLLPPTLGSSSGGTAAPASGSR